jgi:penicillin-binding protein 1A
LPSFALFLKKCYADKSLQISQEEFEKPENLSININCGKVEKEDDEIEDDTEEIIIIEEDTDF